MPTGCVDIANHQQIAGWLAPGADDAPGQRFVRVTLDGRELGTIRADQFRSDLRDAGVSDGHSGFTFAMPTVPDPLVDHVIEVQDRDSGRPLPPSPIKLVAITDPTSNSMLGFDPSMVATHLASAQYSDGAWSLEVWLFGPGQPSISPSVIGGKIEHFASSELETFWIGKGILRRTAQIKIRPNGHTSAMYLDLLSGQSVAEGYKPVLRIVLPADMPSYSRGIPFENMARVVGPLAAPDIFCASGVNTAFRLDSLLRRHFGKGFEGFDRILDWGIGAGRISLPIKHLLAPEAHISGTDVDHYNVEFGRKKYPDIEFIHSGFYPPLSQFADGTFDMAFGISVFTHLTEETQFAWLAELHRLVKPGAPVITTVHGDHAIFVFMHRDAAVFGEAATRGIVDRFRDDNLGPKLDQAGYYRATLHTRKYVAREWSKYFDVLAHYSCANVAIQDFVVLRRK